MKSRDNRSANNAPSSSPEASAISAPQIANRRFIIALLIACYLLFGVIHLFSTPLGGTGYQDAPDEAAHVSYVRSVMLGHFPSKQHPHAAGAAGYPDYEWHQPPLYYIAAAPLLAGGERAIRLLSLICGVLTVLVVYKTARLIRPDSEIIAITAAGFAALIPGHVAITSAVNNDSLLELLISLLLLQLVQLQIKGGGTKSAVAIGMLVAAGILTKVTALLMMPVVLTAFWFLYRRGENVKLLGKQLVIVFLSILMASGWWFVRNKALYGELLPLHAFQKAFEGTAQAADVVNGGLGLNIHGWGEYWQRVFVWCYNSFWAVYGTPKSAQFGVPLFLPDSVYLLTAVIVLGAFVGITRLHFIRDTLFDAAHRHALYLMLFTLAFVVLAYVSFAVHYFQTQGRYLYPAISTISLCLSMGWLALFPKKYEKAASAGVLGFLALLSILFAVSTSNRQAAAANPETTSAHSSARHTIDI